jgi:DNA adenine methylase
MSKILVDYIPPHRTYVEVFGGSGALLFAKHPSPVEIYNDIDSGLVNFFRVLRDREKAEELARLVELTPYSREEYNFARENWEKKESDVERAFLWFVVAVMGFSGIFGEGFAPKVKHIKEGSQKWKRTGDKIIKGGNRFYHVMVENASWQKILDIYDTPQTFFYLDPPYSFTARSPGNCYTHEIDNEEHEKIAARLLTIQGKALLSGYDCPQYKPLETAGWIRSEWETVCSAAGRTKKSGLQGIGNVKREQKRTEVLWANYDIYSAKEPELFEAAEFQKKGECP